VRILTELIFNNRQQRGRYNPANYLHGGNKNLDHSESLFKKNIKNIKNIKKDNLKWQQKPFISHFRQPPIKYSRIDSDIRGGIPLAGWQD
jgi:hypothetical protein